jgi:hypothetical protein
VSRQRYNTKETKFFRIPSSYVVEVAMQVVVVMQLLPFLFLLLLLEIPEGSSNSL